MYQIRHTNKIQKPPHLLNQHFYSINSSPYMYACFRLSRSDQARPFFAQIVYQNTFLEFCKLKWQPQLLCTGELSFTYTLCLHHCCVVITWFVMCLIHCVCVCVCMYIGLYIYKAVWNAQCFNRCKGTSRAFWSNITVVVWLGWCLYIWLLCHSIFSRTTYKDKSYFNCQIEKTYWKLFGLAQIKDYP